MSPKTENRIVTFYIPLLGTILVTVFLVIIMITADKQLPKDLEDDNDAQIELINAYSDLLHRVWIDEPLYVERVLKYTDEFETLDSLKEGDHEDTFLFWSKYDSLNYVSAKETDLLLDSLLGDYVDKHLYIPEYE